MNNTFSHAAPTRTSDEIAILDGIDARVRDLALSFRARDVRYPALVARTVLEQAEYPRAFPHLLLSASRTEHLAEVDAARNQTPTEWCLSPAVCYHTYAQLTGSVIHDPVVMTARGRCFRYEAETAPGIRQIEFEMREIVLVGAADWVQPTAESIKNAIESLARELGLVGDWQVAEDPFFLPRAAGKALMQRLLKVKLEYQSHQADRLALASVNRHGPFFGERFDITTPAGQPVHTACVAVGLDRWCQRMNGAFITQEVTVCTA